ncbi:Os04g0143100 [Oryza sativa Japonica Group]|uniref:Os04g0143100 protein n=1 Tax=Oryza sativa subsp. japonica TaxID=39947 RepID=A0A0P0W6I5_ORYSJ|nr:Os04g0143100 [Oryza sativa Japonica Group]
MPWKTALSFRQRVNVLLLQPIGKPDNDQILLVAHGNLHVTKGAFIDNLQYEHDAEEQEILPKTWDENRTLYKVVEMELSLMYDILYTKAAMVHTWGGYAIRVAFPFTGATAFLLFWFHSEDGQSTADVFITYILLAGTIILDIIWLLKALVSTWTYSFLNDRPRIWLHHALLCSGKWRLLHRLIVSLNLFRFLLNKEPTSYRMWSGTMGAVQHITRVH